MFASNSFTQKTQHVALLHQMRALLSAVRKSTFDLPFDEMEALSDHDQERQQVPVIVSTVYRRLVERIAE